jgi:formiminotetrahydrofolate cyclodeaminase
MTDLQEKVKEILSKYDCPQNTFARLVGREEAALSRQLNGFSGLKSTDREKFARAIEFIVALATSSAAPVCFHKFQKIQPLWNAFQRTRKQLREETEMHAVAN